MSGKENCGLCLYFSSERIGMCGVECENIRLRFARENCHSFQMRRDWDLVIGFDLGKYISDQRAFSEETFGPGARTIGILSHIRKELEEIESDPNDLEEWIDLLILGLDGAWRAGFEPAEIIKGLIEKQKKNFGRDWPDWRNFGQDEAIEHIRSEGAE